MGFIANVLDRFAGGTNRWLSGEWFGLHNEVCIMGALGLVLQDRYQVALKPGMPSWLALPENFEIHTVGEHPEWFTDAELNEIWAFFTVVCENYGQELLGTTGGLKGMFGGFYTGTCACCDCGDCECTCGLLSTGAAPDNVLTKTLHSLVTNLLITWNDSVVMSYTKDIQPMLEKTAIRIAEQV